MRVAAAEGCIGYDAGGRRYNTDKTGHLDLPPSVARMVVDAGGAFIPGVGVTRSRKNFRCPACGFRPVFRLCKCGTEAVEEA